MRASPGGGEPATVSYAVARTCHDCFLCSSAAVLAALGWLGRGVGSLAVFAFLGATVFTIGAVDVAVRGCRSRRPPPSVSPD